MVEKLKSLLKNVSYRQNRYLTNWRTRAVSQY